MEAILTFAGGRLLYTLIDRFQLRLILLELAFIATYIGASALLLSIENIELRSLLIGATFIFTGIVARLLHGGSPVEAPGKAVAIGIVDFVWLAIMGAALAIVIFGRAVPPFSDSLPPEGLPNEYYQKTYDTVQFLLGWVINSVPILGATVAACMAILWAGELWTKGEKARPKYASSTIAAIKMVVAFFVVISAFLYWLGIPLYFKMIALTELLKQ
jgi:uncharacterized membrane protein YidH (DUF202 family)